MGTFASRPKQTIKSETVSALNQRGTILVTATLDASASYAPSLSRVLLIQWGKPAFVSGASSEGSLAESSV